MPLHIMCFVMWHFFEPISFCEEKIKGFARVSGLSLDSKIQFSKLLLYTHPKCEEWYDSALESRVRYYQSQCPSEYLCEREKRDSSFP